MSKLDHNNKTKAVFILVYAKDLRNVINSPTCDLVTFISQH